MTPRQPHTFARQHSGMSPLGPRQAGRAMCPLAGCSRWGSALIPAGREDISLHRRVRGVSNKEQGMNGAQWLPSLCLSILPVVPSLLSHASQLSCSSCIPCWDNCLNIAMAFHVFLCGTLGVSWSHSISLSLGWMSSVISPSLTQWR